MKGYTLNKRLLQSIGTSESTSVEWKQSLGEMKEIIESVAAFANTEGGRIFIGVSNLGEVFGVQIGKGTIENLANQIALHTEPKIQPRITIKKINGKQIIIVDVKRSTTGPVLADGRPYKRVGKSSPKMGKDEHERIVLEKHKGKQYFDEQICEGAKISDISKEKLSAFIKEAKQERGLSIGAGLSVTDILRKLKLVKDGKLTNGAILLFGKDTQDFFLQSELKAIRFKGLDETKPMLDFKTIGGDAITLLKKAEAFIFDHIPMQAWIENGKLQRQEKWLFPPKAIREALANALAHRDYSSPGKVQVRIFDDRLEIWNPGLLSPPLTLEKLKGKHDSMPRNPFVAKMFFWIKYAEDVGSGTNKIIQWCKEWGLPEPTYEEAGASFVTVFHNPKQEQGVLKTIQKTTQKTIQKTGQKIVEEIRKNPQITRKELAEIIGLTDVGIKYHLSNMQKKNLLRRIGPDKGGYWEILSTHVQV